MSAWQLKTFTSPENMAAAMAEDARTLLRSATRHNNASLVVSGGSTPRLFFNELRGRDLPWRRLNITLADERWVDASSPQSNEHLIRSQLLVPGAEFTPLKTHHSRAADGLGAVAERISALPSPFALTCLGMGDDGHTASLFPGQPLEMNGPCVATIAPNAPHERISLSMPRILNSAQIFIHIHGADKLKLLSATRTMPLPIDHVLRQMRTPVTVYCAS